MRTFAEECMAYRDEEGVHKDIWERFTEYVNTTSYLKAHRDFVEKNFYGFGDRSFHWLWKLLVDEMPPEFRFLEIGVYCGQMLSLVPLVAREQGKRCQALGVTLLSAFSGKTGEFPPFPDVDYLEKIKDIHREFGLLFCPWEGLIVGDSTGSEVQARAANRGPFDIVYVDGCHEYDYVERDLRAYGEMVKAGGYLVVDDASCRLHIPWGMFSGIEPVSRATEKVIVNHPEIWQECLVVMHNRVFLRILKDPCGRSGGDSCG
jgi:hypothetical protein